MLKVEICNEDIIVIIFYAPVAWHQHIKNIGYAKKKKYNNS